MLSNVNMRLFRFFFRRWFVRIESDVSDNAIEYFTDNRSFLEICKHRNHIKHIRRFNSNSKASLRHIETARIVRQLIWAVNVCTLYSFRLPHINFTHFECLTKKKKQTKNRQFAAIENKLNTALTCETPSSMESNVQGNPIPSIASKSPTKDRFIQSPSSNQMAPNGSLQTIAQPYAGEVSNFGAFYHHHHHNHIPATYGIPYDKFKYPSNSRSPTNSPYGSYQGFYPGNVHHHHHRQMVRPNGYIDLVPR